MTWISGFGCCKRIFYFVFFLIFCYFLFLGILSFLILILLPFLYFYFMLFYFESFLFSMFSFLVNFICIFVSNDLYGRCVIFWFFVRTVFSFLFLFVVFFDYIFDTFLSFAQGYNHSDEDHSWHLCAFVFNVTSNLVFVGYFMIVSCYLCVSVDVLLYFAHL